MAAGKTYPLSLVLTAVDKVTAVTGKVEKSLAKVGKSVTKAGKSLTTNLTLPVVGIGAAATKGFAEFEAGMASVSTLIDTNTEDLGAMGDEILRIGKDTPVALNDLTAGLYQVRSAGVSAADQFTVLEGSAQLAVAGLGTTEQAVDLVTSAINDFGLKGEAATKIYDQVFKAVKFGKTNISELAQGFGGVAAQVASTGTSVQEYLAAAAALTTSGQKASQSHTQLRAAIQGLTRDTKQSRKVFRALGVKTFDELVKKSGGMVPAFRAITKQLGGSKAKILELVGSGEALNAMLGLSGAQAEAFDTTIAAMNDNTNAAAEGFKKQNQTLTATWQKTKNNLLAAGMTIGKALAPILQKVADKIRDLTDWFSGLDDSTKNWIMRVAAVVAAVGPMLIVVGKAITVASMLARGIGLISTAIRFMTGVLIANPIGALIAVIATAAYLIYEHWDGVSEFFRILWDDVKGYFKTAWEFIEPIAGKIVAVVEAISDAGSAVADLIVSDVPGQSIEEGRRLHGLPPPKKPGKRESKITVDINGAPRGTRVEADPKSDDEIATNVGFQMGAP